MFYSRAYVSVLEKQIDDLKGRLSEIAVLQRQLAEARMEIAESKALREQIRDLQERALTAEEERQAMLDRLLERKNYQPIHQPSDEKASLPPSVQIISPYNSIPFETQDAIRESWILEEAGYLVNQAGLDEARAWAEAEARWQQKNTAIK